MAHHTVKTTVKNIGLILLQILTANLNAMLKNWGSDHILIPFYPKKTKLFFSFGYNYFNHTGHNLRNEQLIRLNRQLNANSSEHKEALQHVAIITGHSPVLPTASASARTGHLLHTLQVIRSLLHMICSSRIKPYHASFVLWGCSSNNFSFKKNLYYLSFFIVDSARLV